MANRESDKEELNNREKGLVRMRSITNYVMGILLLGAGCFFFFPTPATAKYLDQYDPSMIKVFAIICWIYGLFRIFRAYKKNYFRNG